MDQPKRIRWIPALVCNAVLIPFMIAHDVASLLAMGSRSFSDADMAALGIAIAAGVVAVPAVVLSCIVLYRCWASVPKEIARTTPGKAVGLLFVPFYDFYWAFVCYQGLAEDLHKAKGGENYRSLGIAMGILFITECTMAPYPVLGTLAGMAGFIVWIIFTKCVVDQARQDNVQLGQN